MSSITTKHPELAKYEPRWERMADALDEQDVIHNKSQDYLPKTSGMEGSVDGDKRYDAYKRRARWYGIVRQTLTGIVGLMFEKNPEGTDEAVVTRTGQNNVELARDVARDISSFGRSILLVDAPKKGGNGKPFIVRYHPSALINWKTDTENGSQFTLAVLKEAWPDPDLDDEFSHDTVGRYRVYRKVEGRVSVTVYDGEGDVIEDERPLTVKEIPIFAIGSIGVDPACDPVPLLPVADAAVAIYQISADLRQDLYSSGQKQPYQKGVTEEQYDANLAIGYGAGGCWILPMDGEAGLIESTGSAYASASAERAFEFDQAASYAVKMTQKNDGAESGRALEIRAAAQHASIYTMADSISIGVNMACEARSKWAAEPAPVPFAIRTEFTSSEAFDQIMNALNTAINSGNAPRTPMFELLRRNGLTELTDEEQQAEINEQMPAQLPEPKVAVVEPEAEEVEDESEEGMEVEPA